nr:MAG TPA: hypothetical protein [Caudoviricetes sp.]
MSPIVLIVSPFWQIHILIAFYLKNITKCDKTKRKTSHFVNFFVDTNYNQRYYTYVVTKCDARKDGKNAR